MIFNLNGGSGDGSIKYDAETDMIQIKDDSGNWHDWKSAGLLSTVLYDNGIQYVQFDVGHVWRYNSTSYKDSEARDKDIYVFGTSSAGTGATGTTATVDVSAHNYLVFEIVNGETALTLEVDISQFSGLYYVGMAYNYGNKKLYYGLTSTKNLGTGAVLVKELEVSSNTTYIKKVYLRK